MELEVRRVFILIESPSLLIFIKAKNQILNISLFSEFIIFNLQ